MPLDPIVRDSARVTTLSRLAGGVAFTKSMRVETVSTAKAAALLGVTEQVVRNRIADNEIRGVAMEGGAWRIPLTSISLAVDDRPVVMGGDTEPPQYVQRLIDRLDAFDTGMIPCAEAARIAGVGVKAMRNGLRSGRIPGGRLLGGSWLVSVVEFGAWLGIRRVA
jgi:excisionase family DNA binding protein